MFYLYILKSKIDNDLYIGSTNDLKKDLQNIMLVEFFQRGRGDPLN